MAASRTLVLGGARSGKSAWAESLFDASVASGATADPSPVDYVATARPAPGAEGFDRDFAVRIAAHRERRPDHWRTVDDVDAVDALRRPGAANVLLDDVGTWLTGVFDRQGLWDAPRGSVAPWTDDFVAAVRDWPGPDHATTTDASPHLVVVTPEVGMGVIPEHRSGRLFRDEIGLLNGKLAEVCDRVVLVVAGVALPLKQVRPAHGRLDANSSDNLVNHDQQSLRIRRRPG
ncbi:bifunctional adenosylcobinamide kinase/adenosylcobinamide-phosphate guanylyltransferase [uncultured Corynebacterium sp.]|uniref:bifunctional adenosylcobinamide kinase/adenosylcobinamide-phosphate guanylyltransferase n=1 Tax=uncultured Corynebacterium sp. TaxID=159447 RepID=UPI0025DA01A5|nr:bifunctional adenosylcobinamide kinase/adenosylcobinamide-phosphate guanylyltransferase [uncultured Corynebacterium sp.]